METKLNFKSIIELVRYFDTEHKCIKYLEQIRWGNDIRCCYCFGSNPYKFKDDITYKCSDSRCSKKFNVKTKSIFEATKLPLSTWLSALYLFTSHKKGISSVQMAKDVGITQKSAWIILHKIRENFTELQAEQMFGTIEVDETFVGGKNKNRHKDKKVKYSQGRSFKDKTPVLGLYCRESGKVRTFVIPNTSRKAIQPVLFNNISEGSNVMTDEWHAYKGINSVFNHNFIRHDIKQYADGDTYTNNIEGFWSHLKRGIIGIYHKTSRKYLANYAHEYEFRFNTRTMNESQRLEFSIGNIFSCSHLQSV